MCAPVIAISSTRVTAGRLLASGWRMMFNTDSATGRKTGITCMKTIQATTHVNPDPMLQVTY
jgi:hypothetical protein